MDASLFKDGNYYVLSMRKSVYVHAYRSAGGAGRTDKYKQGLIWARDTGRACEQFSKQSTTNKEWTDHDTRTSQSVHAFE